MGGSSKEMRREMKDRLVRVQPGGLGPCGDGRMALDGRKLFGPKILGGVLGVVAQGLGKNPGETVKEEDIRLACKIVRTAGFTPSIHGDTRHGESGCGFGRLWSQGELTGLPRLGVSLERIREIVIEEGGEYVVLDGEHEETFVAINYVRDTTFQPDGSCFIVDAWAAKIFGINQRAMLTTAAEVVRKLGGPRQVVEIR